MREWALAVPCGLSGLGVGLLVVLLLVAAFGGVCARSRVPAVLEQQAARGTVLGW